MGLLVCGAGGCSTEVETVGHADVRSAVRGAHPEWEREITRWTGNRVRPRAFRAGGGLVTLLDAGPPIVPWMLMFADSARGAAGGMIDPNERGSRPVINDATDVVGVSGDGRSWILDPSTGRVTSEDVGGHRKLVASLGVRGTVRTACALGERAIAYLDDARPGRVFVRDLDSAAPTRALSVPDDLASDDAALWPGPRFGGSPAGPCVLWSPRMRGILVVTDSSVRALAPFVEPLPEPERRDWLAQLLRRGTPEAPDSSKSPVGALDATSFPGGVAVLFSGRTADAGRLVDLYTDEGEYLETMRLPHRALRIAATRHRLLVLSQRSGRVLLSSYVLPARARTSGTDDEPAVIAPPPPIGTRDSSTAPAGD